jgi:23S rRNA pseudouridine1911/1915/1917 synthase
MTIHHFTTKIPQTMAGWRLDRALASLFPDYSRARLQQWLLQGHILVNATLWRKAAKRFN